MSRAFSKLKWKTDFVTHVGLDITMDEAELVARFNGENHLVVEIILQS